MDSKLLALENKVSALKGLVVRQKQQLHYFKNKSKRNIILSTEPRVRHEEKNSSICSETVDGLNVELGVKDLWNRQMKKEKQPVPNFHAPEFMDRMSTKDLHYHVNSYLREIERRCISHGKSMDFAGERTNIWYGENSLVEQRAICKSPKRPQSARKRSCKRLYSSKKGRIQRRTKSFVGLNLKERKRVMKYVLNHRQNVGARILNGGYYHVVSNYGDMT